MKRSGKHFSGCSLEGRKGIAKTYTSMGYDLMIFDFRGFGKSEEKITSEKQFYDDFRGFYDKMFEM